MVAVTGTARRVLLAHCAALLGLVAVALAGAPARAAGSAAAGADPLLVFAAASLTESLSAVADAYAAAGHPRPTLSFAASSVLARQIEKGAPAGLFLSADEAWMDYLADRRLIVPATRARLLGNRLVLVAPAGRPLRVTIRPGFALAALLGDEKLAMADVETVPAGRYGKAALRRLGVWAEVEPKVVRGDSVRAALAFVERDAARAGIVYATDATASTRVMVAGVFPADSHPPISYPVALIAGQQTPEARAFRAFLATPAAGAIFSRFGFTVARAG